MSIMFIANLPLMLEDVSEVHVKKFTLLLHESQARSESLIKSFCQGRLKSYECAIK